MRDDDRTENTVAALGILLGAGVLVWALSWTPPTRAESVPRPQYSAPWDGVTTAPTTTEAAQIKTTTVTTVTLPTPTTLVPAPAGTVAPVREKRVDPVPAFGLRHACQVLSGRVFCNGTTLGDARADMHGALGPVTGGGEVPLPGKASQVVAGQDTSCALVSGVPHCWGWRSQVGAQDGATPRAMAVSGADKLYAGDGGTICALDLTSGGLDQKGEDDAGALYCWGEGVSVDGLTGRDWADEPVKLAESADWDDVAISGRTICTLNGEVSLTCYGDLPGGGHSDTGLIIDTNKAFRHITITTHAIGNVSVCATREDGTNVACY